MPIRDPEVKPKPRRLLGEPRNCHTCSKLETSEVYLYRCGRCRKVLYCSDECQEKDYPVHLHICHKDEFAIEMNEVSVNFKEIF